MRSNANLNNQDIMNWFKTPDDMKFTDGDNFPILDRCDIRVPRKGMKILPFNYAKSSKDKDIFVHFYIQDYQFNRIWNRPQKYIDMLKKFKGIVMPDFSYFTDMPVVLQKYAHYKNLWFARMCQLQGITVIPSIVFGDRSSWS